MPDLSRTQQNHDYTFTSKWSKETESCGFTQIPNILIACQGHLGLKDSEVVALLLLLMHWYRHSGKIYPSIATLAQYSNKGYSTVQKTLSSLEKKGFIKRRQRRGTSSIYDVKYCAIKLHEHQKVCESLLHKRSRATLKIKHNPSSNTTNKEYEIKRQNKKKSSQALGEIITRQYSDSFTEKVWRV